MPKKSEIKFKLQLRKRKKACFSIMIQDKDIGFLEYYFKQGAQLSIYAINDPVPIQILIAANERLFDIHLFLESFYNVMREKIKEK